MRVIGGDPRGRRSRLRRCVFGSGPCGSRTGSYDRRGRVIPAEERALTSDALSKTARRGRLAMSLETPEKIRNLQRKLYCKAKAEPAFRFYILYDKICRDDVLRHAYALACANAGAQGVDGTTFEQID